MEYLPPAGWADLGTTAELRRTEAVLHADIERVETTLRTDIERVETTLRAEMSTIRAELAAQGSELRADLATAMSGVDRRMVAQTRTLMMGMVATVVATFGAGAAFH
jgi:hypothetical protein